jgi:dihydrolipoamide dehydrogenase
VTILEAAPTFLAAADESVQKETFKIFTKEQGLDIQLGVKINSIVNNKEKGVEINYEKDGVAQTLNVERLIVSVGRTANTEGLNLNAIGLTTDERGCVPINEACQTGVKNVYAIGDVVRGPMLAHKAEDEGVYVAEIIAGQHPHINYDCIPWVIYTSPEIAWAGKTEQQLKAENREYKTGQFSFMANGRALGQGSAKGFVKMIACKHTDEVLGVHVVHQNACELIAEAVVAMEFSASSEDIARIIHAHPSLSEAMKEAALAVDKRAIHM